MAKAKDLKKDVDVYRDWLGIADPARPLDHYTLLKLKKFEDDADTVRRHYRELNAHVRKYAAGEFGPQSQALLNELAKAMLCLTDIQRKGEYDAVLGRPAQQEGKRRTLEQILLASKAVTPEQLQKVRGFADAVGLPIRDALLQQKAADPAVIMQAHAESIGLSYIDLTDVEIDESLVPNVPTHVARQYLCVPVMIDDNMLLLASPNPVNPDIEDDLRLRFGVPARTVLCTPASINALVARYYPAGAKGAARPVAAAMSAAPGSPAAAAVASPAESKAQLKRFAMMAWIGIMGMVILFIAYKMVREFLR
jgi:hypothetical protein